MGLALSTITVDDWSRSVLSLSLLLKRIKLRLSWISYILGGPLRVRITECWHRHENYIIICLMLLCSRETIYRLSLVFQTSTDSPFPFTGLRDRNNSFRHVNGVFQSYEYRYPYNTILSEVWRWVELSCFCCIRLMCGKLLSQTFRKSCRSALPIPAFLSAVVLTVNKASLRHRKSDSETQHRFQTSIKA